MAPFMAGLLSLFFVLAPLVVNSANTWADGTGGGISTDDFSVFVGGSRYAGTGVFLLQGVLDPSKPTKVTKVSKKLKCRNLFTSSRTGKIAYTTLTLPQTDLLGPKAAKFDYNNTWCQSGLAGGNLYFEYHGITIPMDPDIDYRCGYITTSIAPSPVRCLWPKTLLNS